MRTRFLSIRNFEQYNPGSTRSYPWIKVYRSLLLDIDFLQLDVTSRYLYVCLLILASDHANKIPMSVSYLSHRCAMNVSEEMLKPLYRLGFLQASRSTIARLEKSKSREDIDIEGEAPAVQAAPSLNGHQATRGKRAISDEDKPTDKHFTFGKSLGLDVGPEWGKFKNYCLAHDKRYANFDAAFRNWLANAAQYTKEARHVLR
jgi:hypothetical protein